MEEKRIIKATGRDWLSQYGRIENYLAAWKAIKRSEKSK